MTGCILEQALQEDWPGFSSLASYGPWPSDSTSAFSFLTCKVGFEVKGKSLSLSDSLR